MRLTRELEWTHVDWARSWEPELDLERILPAVGETCTVPGAPSYEIPDDGRVDVLWCPPHSELNGWSDRPSEILRSHVLHTRMRRLPRRPPESCGEGEWPVSVEVEVLGREPLTTVMCRPVPPASSPLGRYYDIHHSGGVFGTFTAWEAMWRVYVSRADPWIYLRGENQEACDDLIVTVRDGAVTVHFASSGFSCHEQAHVLRYRTSGEESELFLHLIETSARGEEDDPSDLPLHRVRGAGYW